MTKYKHEHTFFFHATPPIFLTSAPARPPPRDLGASVGRSPSRPRCEVGRGSRGGRGCGGNETGPAPGGVERSSGRAVAARAADVGQLLCVEAARLRATPCVGGALSGGSVGGVFHSPVILHNTGQIRLELTAEDIQLDCACHSVASIRVSPLPLCSLAQQGTTWHARSFYAIFHLC